MTPAAPIGLSHAIRQILVAAEGADVARREGHPDVWDVRYPGMFRPHAKARSGLVERTKILVVKALAASGQAIITHQDPPDVTLPGAWPPADWPDTWRVPPELDPEHKAL